MRLARKKISVYILSVLLLCGCSVMTIEGEIKDEFLYYSKGHNQTCEVRSDSETNPKDIDSGVSVNVQFSKHLDNCIRESISSGCNIESGNFDNSSSSGCESTGLYLEECTSDSNNIFCNSKSTEQYVSG